MTSDKSQRAFPIPERGHLRIGYLPLIDCAPLIAAQKMNFGQPHGLTLELCKQASWAAIRDKLLSGELDAAQTLYGLVYGVQLGLGGPQSDMAILMTLNRNGQAITVSNQIAALLQEKQSLKSVLAGLGRKPVFAQTFPTGTHAMWLNYWLAAQGIDPLRDIDSVVIPPPLMADALAHGELDGFCAGEPWHAVAQSKRCGITIVSSSQIWPNHPEKALACRLEFATLYPSTVQALIRTLLTACQWLENPENKITVSGWLAQPAFLNVAEELIAARLLGDFGSNQALTDALPIRFFDQQGMNAPLPGDGLWFLEQFHRWGLLESDTNWNQIVTRVSQTEQYTVAVRSIGLATPSSTTGSVKLIDGRVWDGVRN